MKFRQNTKTEMFTLCHLLLTLKLFPESLGEAHFVNLLQPECSTNNQKSLGSNHHQLVSTAPLMNSEAIINSPSLLLLLDLHKLSRKRPLLRCRRRHRRLAQRQ